MVLLARRAQLPQQALESDMPADSVRCRVDIFVVDGKLEAALRDLRRSSSEVLGELSKRRRDGPTRREKRRNKHYFAVRYRRWRWPWRHEADDELERARRDQAMFTRRAAERRADPAFELRLARGDSPAE